MPTKYSCWLVFLFLIFPLAAGPTTSAADGAMIFGDRTKQYKSDLDALLKHLDKECQLLSQKKIKWNKVSSEARKRLKSVTSDVEFYGLLVWVVGQLRDSHAHVAPKDQSLATAWNEQKPQQRQVPMALMPGAHDLVLVSWVSDAMQDLGIEVGLALDSINGEGAWDWFEERSQERFLEGYYSTIHRARTVTFSYGVILPGKGMVELEFKKPKLAEKERASYLKASFRKRAKILKKTPAWESVSIKISEDKCQPARFLGHGFPQWQVPEIERVSGMTAYAKLPSGNGYVNLRNVNGGSQPAELQKAFEALKDCPALVVDLRWNGGGGGEGQVAACFPGRGRVEGHEKWTKPVAVLVGPRVMSSGDSVAYYLKNTYNHELFGENTSGAPGPKGRFELPSGFASVLFVRSQWRSRSLEGIGVAPDNRVLQDVVELSCGMDSVLGAAEKHLKKKARR